MFRTFSLFSMELFNRLIHQNQNFQSSKLLFLDDNDPRNLYLVYNFQLDQSTSPSYMMYEDNSRPYLAKICLVYIQEKADTQRSTLSHCERLENSFEGLLIILSKRIYWVSKKSRSERDILNRITSSCIL